MEVSFFSDVEQDVQHQVVYYGPRDKKFLFTSEQDAVDFFTESCKYLPKGEFDEILCFLRVMPLQTCPERRECFVGEYYEYSLKTKETKHKANLKKWSKDSLDVVSY